MTRQALLRSCTTVLVGLLAALAEAQTAPTLKSLAASHRSIVAGNVTITNFHTPREFPIHFLDVLVPEDGDSVAVTAKVRPDGNVDLVFTAINPVTGAPSPMMINAANGSSLPSNRLFMMQYDVIVNNPHLALKSVNRAFGPGTHTTGATGVFNFGYTYTGIYSGSIVGVQQYLMQHWGGGASNLNSWTTGAGAALIPATYGKTPATAGTPVTFGSFSGAKLGNEWGLGSGPWGGIRTGTASLDSLTITLMLAPATPRSPSTHPGVLGFSASSIFLANPAGAGGAKLALSTAPGVFNGQRISVPSSITIPAGSSYASWPVTKVPPVTIVDQATVMGILGSTAVTAGYEIFPDVYPPAQPQLSVAKMGTGKGTIVSSDRVISCGSKCSGNYALGSGVMLTAQPASGSTFSGWTTGACAGSLTPTCRVTITAYATLAGAKFTAAPNGGGKGTTQFTLAVGVSNAGTVVAVPAANGRTLRCGSACSVQFDRGARIALSATPAPGKSFIGWAGACTGNSMTCFLSVDSNTAAQANFSQ